METRSLPTPPFAASREHHSFPPWESAIMNANLFDRFVRTIVNPDKIAIMTAGDETYTYGALLALSGRLANALVDHGVKPGDRVAAQVEKSVPALILYLATVRAGGVFLPLNTAYTAAEVSYFLEDAQPTLFVCDPARQSSL